MWVFGVFWCDDEAVWINDGEDVVGVVVVVVGTCCSSSSPSLVELLKPP